MKRIHTVFITRIFCLDMNETREYQSFSDCTFFLLIFGKNRYSIVRCLFGFFLSVAMRLLVPKSIFISKMENCKERKRMNSVTI